MVLESDHSTFGGSSAERWGTCPGSLILSKQIHITPDASPYAEEGTRAHAIAECILSGWTPPDYLDAEMVRHAYNYAAGINAYKEIYGGFCVEVERKVISRRYQDVGGTIDALVDARNAGTIIVCDYKFGAGIPVSPVKNEQLQFYAALALESMFPESDGLYYGDVILSIFQPRGESPGWREWETSGTEIHEYLLGMYDRVEAVKQGDVTLEPGKHCRWCEAKPVCPAFHEAYIAPLLPMTPIAHLKNAQVHDIYKLAPQLAQYMKSLEAYIKAQCAAFGSFESFTVAKGRGQTKWLNPISIEAAFPKSQYPGMYNTTLRTPKQILEMYPELSRKLEGQHTQTTYDKLITNDAIDYPHFLDDE